MKSVTNPRLIVFKGFLFVFAGLLAAGLLIFQTPTLKTAFLLAAAVWCFARAYYFCFYVIQHYVDPAFKFSGLGSAVAYLLRRGKRGGDGPGA